MTDGLAKNFTAGKDMKIQMKKRDSPSAFDEALHSKHIASGMMQNSALENLVAARDKAQTKINSQTMPMQSIKDLYPAVQQLRS
jgi:hypothetical protein